MTAISEVETECREKMVKDAGREIKHPKMRADVFV